MQPRMVPTVVTGPGRVLCIDSEGCLSLEVSTAKIGDDFAVEIRDLDFPGQCEPRRALFYSVSDRSLFMKAILADRMETLSRLAPRRSYRFRPMVKFA